MGCFVFQQVFDGQFFSFHGLRVALANKILFYIILQAIPLIANMIRVNVTVPESYVDAFARVDMTFKHQSTFDPVTRKEVCLEPLPVASNFIVYPLYHSFWHFSTVTHSVLLLLLFSFFYLFIYLFFFWGGGGDSSCLG